MLVVLATYAEHSLSTLLKIAQWNKYLLNEQLNSHVMVSHLVETPTECTCIDCELNNVIIDFEICTVTKVTVS